MRFVISSWVLDYSGVPTYTRTLVKELRTRGHEVIVYSPKGGRMRRELPCVEKLSDVPTPDVILAQHNKCAHALRKHWPKVPMVYSSHGVLPEIEQVPRGITVDWYTAINQQVKDNMVRQWVTSDRIDIVRDFIDVDEFAPREPLGNPDGGPPRVLFISNYKKWKNYQRIEDAARYLGWPLKAIGAPYGLCKDVASAINQSDIVVTWARGILEGMACGRPVVSYDKDLGDGYIDREMYFESRERNFSGYECHHAFTARSLAHQLARYDPIDGAVNRALATSYHGQRLGADLVLAAAEKARAGC